MGVPADSVEESASPATAGRRRAGGWGCRPGRRCMQANYAVSRRIEELGGVVLNGREAPGPHGHDVADAAPRAAAARAWPSAAGARRVRARGAGRARRRRGWRSCSSASATTSTGAARLRPAGALRGRDRAGHEDEQSRCSARRTKATARSCSTSRSSRSTIRSSTRGRARCWSRLKPDRATGTMRRWLDQSGPVVGVANHMGSLATQDMTLMGAVYRELQRRHLPFIHVQPAAGAVCRPLAAEMGVIYDEPDAVLDAEARATTRRRRWTGAGARSSSRPGRASTRWSGCASRRWRANGSGARRRRSGWAAWTWRRSPA